VYEGLTVVRLSSGGKELGGTAALVLVSLIPVVRVRVGLRLWGQTKPREASDKRAVGP
jgi:hypothetical protein